VVSPEGLPDCLEITAKDDSGQIMALRHKEYDLVGLQFHPESIMTTCGEPMLRAWVEATQKEVV
jgi:anthranilate synthase component 2